MTKFVTIVVSAVFLMCLVVEVHSLTCLRCNSTDVNSSCRTGRRGKTTRRRQLCVGVDSACFAVATVNEFGSAYFQRGCTSEDVCKERDDTEIEFCITCKSKFCNYDVMVLDQEVEDYLNEVRNYYFSLESVEKSHTAANEENLKKMNDSPSGIVSVLQEVLSKSSTNSEQNLNKLADDDLNDNFNNFGKRVSSADLAFGDEDTASAHNEDIEFRDNDLDEIEHYDFDVRMDRPKHLVKRN